MRWGALVLVAVFVSSGQASAQDNPPPLVGQLGKVRVTGTTRIATVNGSQSGKVIVSAKETYDPAGGSRVYLVAVEATQVVMGAMETTALAFIPEDEVQKVLDGLDQLVKMTTASATKLDEFEATFQATDQLRFAAFSHQAARMGSISCGKVTVMVAHWELAAMRKHIAAARDKLDALKKAGAKTPP